MDLTEGDQTMSYKRQLLKHHCGLFTKVCTVVRLGYGSHEKRRSCIIQCDTGGGRKTRTLKTEILRVWGGPCGC